MRLQIEYLPLEQLKTYVNNAKLHPAEQIEQIKKSIIEFGFDDPIAVWGDDTIIEGHGRLIAATELQLDMVPVIRLDHLTDEQRKAYALVHNKLTMNSGFDFDILEEELQSIANIDMEDFGFTDIDLSFDIDEKEDEGTAYSTNVKIPQYIPQGDCPTIEQLYDKTKTNSLIKEIEEADIDEDTKKFLRDAAQRHTVFDYRNIAEFYAHAEPEVQKLMEKSALVIIDVKDAIAYGYMKLMDKVKVLEGEEEY